MELENKDGSMISMFSDDGRVFIGIRRIDGFVAGAWLERAELDQVIEALRALREKLP